MRSLGEDEEERTTMTLRIRYVPYLDAVVERQDYEQETALRQLEYDAGLRPKPPAKLTTWLRNQRRKAARERKVYGMELVPDPMTVEGSAADLEVTLESCETLVRWVQLGRSYDRLHQETGVPVSALRQRVSREREVARRILIKSGYQSNGETCN